MDLSLRSERISPRPSPRTDVELVDFARARHGALGREWRRLAADGSPFTSPEFFALQLPLVAAGEPLVAFARREGVLVGAIPFLSQERTLLPLRTLHSHRYDFLGDASAATQVLRALGRDDRWDVMMLKDFPEGSPFVAAARALDDGTHVVVQDSRRTPIFALEGFEERLTAKFRANLRRCARKVPELVHERLVRYDRALFDEALRIEALAWKGAAGSAIESEPLVEHAYRALARISSLRGQWSLHFMRLAERRVAVLLALEHGGTLYAMKIGYDPEFANVSMGHLLVWNVARDALARGLHTFDFLGHEDEWKRKWTQDTSSFVTLRLYRPSTRGHVQWALREVLKPTAAAVVPIVRELAHPAPPRCQRQCILGEHGSLERAAWRVSGGLGIRSGVRRALHPAPVTSPLGRASRFAVDDWVRVRTREEIEATLDERGRLRGLSWVPSQWDACGHVFRVHKPVLRILDDHGRMRAVSGTALLDGVTCAGAGGDAGCGRHCPLMFRDEWLEPAEAPKGKKGENGRPASFARVRSADEARAGLDERGMRDGLLFTDDCAAHAGKRFRVAARLERVFEHDRWLPPRAPIYLLEGLHCSGGSLGDDGPCDRSCALLWHGDWLDLET